MGTSYKRELVRVATGMAFGWRSVPWAFGQFAAAAGELLWSLLPLVLALLFPFMLPLAPIVAWYELRAARRRVEGA